MEIVLKVFIGKYFAVRLKIRELMKSPHEPYLFK